MKQTGPRASVDNFINTDNFFFVFYKLSSELAANGKSSSRLALYDKTTQKEYAHVVLFNKEVPALSIHGVTKMFQSDGKRIISYVQADELSETDLIRGLKRDDNPVLVIYEWSE